MPLEPCEVVRSRGEDHKFGLMAVLKRPGWRWGKKGTCFTYNPGDERSERRAKLRAKEEGSKPKPYASEVDIQTKGSDG